MDVGFDFVEPGKAYPVDSIQYFPYKVPIDFKTLVDQLIGFLAGKGLIEEAKGSLELLQLYFNPAWIVKSDSGITEKDIKK